MKRFGRLAAVLTMILWANALGQDSPFLDPAGPTPTVDDPFVSPPGDASAAPNPFDAATPAPANDPFAPAPQPAVPNPFGATPTSAPSDPFRFPAATPATAAPIGPTDIPLVDTAAVRETQEVRGIYVHSNTRGYQTITQLEQLVADFRAGKFTRIYAEVRTPDGVTYSSQIEEALPTISPLFPNPVLDIKRRLGAEARVIAVVNVLPAYRAVSGSRAPERNPLGRYPEFTMLSVGGQHVAPDNFMHLDPGNPLVLRYLVSILTEIDREVQPDGYLLVGMNYPGSEWGYSPRAIEAFRAAVGGEGPPPPDDPTWMAWRRAQLTNMMVTMRASIFRMRPDAQVSVLVQAEGPPPATWDEWIRSTAYAEKMQDWIGWARSGIVDEVVFEVHERVAPQGNHLREWVQFAGNNTDRARPIISLAGYMNFANGLVRQMDIARNRGAGTILFHYADPVRDPSRGFFNSLPNVFYKNRMGANVPSPKLTGPIENREFTRMPNPPPAVERTESGEFAVATPGTMEGPQDIVFSSPTPAPTQTPAPRFVPDNVVRKITLRSGQAVDATVLELTPTTITFQEEGRSPLMISRSAIRDIEPPL